MPSDGEAAEPERVATAAEARDGAGDQEESGVGGEPAAAPARAPESAPAAAWHAGAYAAADEAFELLLACEGGGPHWRHAGYEQGVAVQSLAYGHAAWAARCPWVDYGYCLFRASEHFPLDAPGAIFEVLHNWDARAGTPDRPGWDSSIHSLKVLQPLPGPQGMPAGRRYAIAQHLSRPAMGGLVGSREASALAPRQQRAVARARAATASGQQCAAAERTDAVPFPIPIVPRSLFSCSARAAKRWARTTSGT